MKPPYREVLDDLSRRIKWLTGVRDAVAEAAERDDTAVGPTRRVGRGVTKKGRAKAGGSDDVIVEVVHAGADTMKKIAAAAQVKHHVAAAAVRRLVVAKRVRAEGATLTRRYLAGPKK